MPSDGVPPIETITRSEDLEAAAARWQSADHLALDTEFVRERTFFPRLGLIQACDGRRTDLVDPLAVTDLGSFRQALRRPGLLKIVHSGSEDMEVFHRCLGALPEPLVDTQIAAGLAGLGASLGYQKLVQTLLGVELFKGETRTDWTQRPLTPQQLEYAAEDVAYLPVLWERLRAELESRGRLEWALEDSANLLDISRLDDAPERAYLRVRGAGRLAPPQLLALQALAAWRESEARRRDLPRGFVLREEALLLLATRLPKTARDLQKLRALDLRQAARDGGTWLETIRGAAAASNDLPVPPKPPQTPSPVWAKEIEKQLREAVRQKAESLGLPPEVLVSRRTLDGLLRFALAGEESGELPSACLRGWRRRVIGEELLHLVRQYSGASTEPPKPAPG